MRKIGIIAMALILAISATACGKRNKKEPATTPSTIPATTAPATTVPATTAPTVVPDIPEMETNIPDPTVNENSTEDFMDGTENTNPPQDTTRARRHHTGK